MIQATEVYQLEQKSSTTASATYEMLAPSGGLPFQGRLACAVLAAGLVLASYNRPATALFQAISPMERPSTVGQFGNSFSHPLDEVGVADFADAVASFYANLLAFQEPLGREFEQVLQANLRDLYVGS